MNKNGCLSIQVMVVTWLSVNKFAIWRGYGTAGAGDVWHSFAKCSCLLFEISPFVYFIVAFSRKLGLG